MRLLRIIFGFLTVAVWLHALPLAAQEQEKPDIKDFQCGTGGNEPYKGDNDPYDSYPFDPAFDIHPARGGCYDNGETLLGNDEGKLRHPEVCYSTELQANTRSNPSLQPNAQAIATRKPELEKYQCGLNTRFDALDDYCGYVGLPRPSPTDSYAVRKAKLMECFKAYIPEYAQLADRGKYVLDRYQTSQVIDDPDVPDTNLSSPANRCYRSWLSEADSSDGSVELLESELSDAFGEGQTQKVKMPQGNSQDMERVRDACHAWSPREDYRKEDTTKGTVVASFFAYNGRCTNLIDQYNTRDKERIDLMNMRIHRFDEYFFQLFDFDKFKVFCSQECKPNDVCHCVEYRDWLRKFFKARAEACKIVARHYSNTIPPSIVDPDFGHTADTTDNLLPFAGRWVFEEPNINNISTVETDPGTVTKKDDKPQPKKSKELLFGSGFKDGKDSEFRPFPAQTVPVYAAGPQLAIDSAKEIESGVSKTNKKIYQEDAAHMDDAPDLARLSVIQGVPGCDQGGAFELMLYQARCMNWFGTTCMCDYNKTFRKGSALNYVLMRAGARIPLTEPQKDIQGHLVYDDNGKQRFQKTTFFWPMVQRGYLTADYAKRYLKDKPTFKKGLQNVRPGSIILWRDISGAPQHAAYVESVSWEAELNQCIPSGGRIGDPPGTRLYDHITVSEMNYGKYRDICGDSDQWGQVTIRTLFNPAAQLPSLPDGSSSDCTNADAITCREANWSNIEIYDPRDMTKDGPDNDIGKNVWGKWDESKIKDTEMGKNNKLDTKALETCYLPRDFSCPDYDSKTNEQYCDKDDDDHYKPKYTSEQKREILRKRRQWAWGRVKLCLPGETSGCEEEIEDCPSGTSEDCCGDGKGSPNCNIYRYLIGCDPPVDLRPHRANELTPSININTLQGRAPLTGADAVIDMTTRHCPIFPDTFYQKENFSCKRPCGAENTGLEDNLTAVVGACTGGGDDQPGNCPQGPGRPGGCLPPEGEDGGENCLPSSGGGSGSGSSSSSSSGNTSGSSSGTSGGSSNGGSGSSSGGSNGASGSNGGSGSGSGGSSSGTSGGNGSSGGSSSGVDTMPKCAVTPGESCDAAACPPKSSCSWATDLVYSEIYVEKLLRGNSFTALPYLPYMTITNINGNSTIQRVKSPVYWLETDASPLWQYVILGTSKNINTATPQAGDIAVIIDNNGDTKGRYCLGQAAVIDSVQQQGGEDCYVLRSTNWQKGCDLWDETTCWQACDASPAPSLHTSDSVFKDKACLTRSDLGTDGYIFRAP